MTSVETEIKELDNEYEDESEELLPFYSITSYGADYPVDGLVKRISGENPSILIPEFQRGFVWKLRESSRFIESLLLGLPVPGIFLSKEEDTQKLLVIDGQQRLRTLQYFYDGVFSDTEREFVLRGVQPQFEGKTYKTLPPEYRTKLDDSIIHATVIKQDQPTGEASSIYLIFERLNTSGVKLMPQEIRACIYHGSFNEVLRDLNERPHWRNIYGPKSVNMRDVEIILRFFAMYYAGDQYKKPMKEFLNSFMSANRKLQTHSREELSSIFVRTVETIHDHVGKDAFRPTKRLNAAVLDAVMVGVAKRISAKGPISDFNSLKQAYQTLLTNDSFKKATETRVTDLENVKDRLTLAISAFAKLA